MMEVIREDRTDIEEPPPSVYWSEYMPAFLANERVRRGVSDVEGLPHLPTQLIDKYVDVAVRRHATLKRVKDGGWFATIPRFRGVWAKEATEERTLEVLREVVSEWTVLKIQHRDRDLPVLDEIDLNVL